MQNFIEKRRLKSKIYITGKDFWGNKSEVFLIPFEKNEIKFLPGERKLNLKHIKVKNNTLVYREKMMIEHLLGSIFLSGVRNIGVEIKGNAPPFLDGSGYQFYKILLENSTIIKNITSESKLSSKKNRKKIFLIKYHKDGLSIVKSNTFKVSYFIYYKRAWKSFMTFRKGMEETIAKARTFGNFSYFLSPEIIKMAKVSNGLIYPHNFSNKEAVAHKILDFTGLLLFIPSIDFHFYFIGGGHRLHLATIKKLKTKIETDILKK